MTLKCERIRFAGARLRTAFWAAALAVALMVVPQASYAQVICADQGGGATAASVGTDGTSCGRNAGNISDRTTSFGFASGASAVGADNSAFGVGTGAYIGEGNSAFGARAGGIRSLLGANLGSFNSAVGFESGGGVTGDANTALGARAGQDVIGSNNLANGANAGQNVTGSNNVAIGTGAGQNINASNTVAIGGNSQASATGSVALGQGSIANQANTVSVGTIGNERRIVNVAAGTIAVGSTDVINGDQLFTANQRVAAAFGGGAGLDANGQLAAPTYSIQGTNFNNVGGAIAAVNTGGTKYYQSNSAGPAASATGANAIAMGSGATATHANSVAIGSGSSTSAANTVSVGAAGNERRITNVAAGISPTDAVNMSQISGITSGIQNQINDNRWEARGGIALALAAGGLHFDTRPGKLSVAGAYGNFKGASGLAFGMGYAATDRVRFNATVSGSPDQGSMGGVVGGSFTLN
jgi:autotransporter adhesin